MELHTVPTYEEWIYSQIDLWENPQSVPNYSYKACEVFSSFCGYTSHALFRLMGVQAADDYRLVKYFDSPEHAKIGKYTQAKPGKLLKKVRPQATDIELSDLAKAWKKTFAPKEYELIVSKEESDFVQAYQGAIVKADPDYIGGSGYELKSLSGSCMRKTFSFLHPSAAYASGDFTIIYAKEKETGLIGARVVVGNESAGPIYTNCDQATKVIVNYLESESIDVDADWAGLKLKKIDIGADKYLCPYIDGYSYIEDCGDYLEICSGRVEFSTCGYVYLEPMGFCEDCEDSVAESDLCEVHGGRFVCPCCRRDNYTYSNLMGEYIPDSECVSVDGDVATQDWIDDNDYVFSEYAGEYVSPDDCIEYEGEYYPTYASCVANVEGNYYHEDSEEYKEALAEQERKEREKKAPYETVESSSFVWLKDKDSICYVSSYYLCYHTEKETRLRQNYQINSKGIPERLPELPFDLVDIDHNFESIN